MTSTTKWAEASCRDHPDPDLWYRTDRASTQRALTLCLRCPVRDACDAAGDTYGTWGGRTARQRARLDTTPALTQRTSWDPLPNITTADPAPTPAAMREELDTADLLYLYALSRDESPISAAASSGINPTRADTLTTACGYPALDRIHRYLALQAGARQAAS